MKSQTSPFSGRFQGKGKNLTIIDFHVVLPTVFSFYRGDLLDFDSVLSHFDWTPSQSVVEIDFTKCKKANYQALALVVLYIWHLRSRGCTVKIRLGPPDGIAAMWRSIGAARWLDVANNSAAQFKSTDRKPLLAIRNQRDFGRSLEKVEKYTASFNVEYEKTLRYVISELLYNTLEHGPKWYDQEGINLRMPSIIQFAWYSQHNELSFIIADLGIGIKQHLEQAYPAFLSHELAIRYSLLPNVSGTFNTRTPYQKKDNAGVGLYLSSQIIRRLDADMYLVSSDGLVHVSPIDTTDKRLNFSWPGTMVLVNVKLGVTSDLNLQSMMSDFRKGAEGELTQAIRRESGDRLYIAVFNLFGRYAEDKEAAIKYRDRQLIPALDRGSGIMIDFQDVVSSPHSFLSALLASPVQMLEMTAYKRIKIINASAEIRETIDFIFEKETSGL